MSISLGARLKKVRYSYVLLAGVLITSVFVTIFTPLFTQRAYAANPGDYNGVQYTLRGDSIGFATGTKSSVTSDSSSSFSRVGNNDRGTFYAGNRKVNTLGGSCPYDYLFVVGDVVRYVRVNAGGFDDIPKEVNTDNAQCGFKDGYSSQGGIAGKLTNPPTNNGGDGTDGGGNTDKQPGCEQQGGALGFILCFVVEQLFDTLNAVHQAAIGYLHFTLIAPDEKFGLKTEQYNQAKESWVFISRLADVWLAVAFIFMIIGTAVTNFLDAYSVKKILPRLIIAIIGVNLSWYICTFILEIGNVFGAGIREIILSPFSNNNAAMVTIATPGGVAGAGVDFLAIVGGFGALFIPGVGGFVLLTLFSLVVPAVMAILLGFVIIIARQGLLILLTIISPLAISMWVLPGTESLFNRWRKIFMTMVVFYPIFQAILAIGVVVAIITTSRG